jgi:hypothetical protein
MRHPPPHHANIYCLVSVNVQQALMNVIGCNFFHMKEFNYTPLFHTHFHETDPLLPSVAQQQNLTEYWREGSASTAISITFASAVVGQHNKMGDITFGMTYVHV